jgi:hypothetical protein
VSFTIFSNAKENSVCSTIFELNLGCFLFGFVCVEILTGEKPKKRNQTAGVSNPSGEKEENVRES